jgi:hypothetical protein
MIIVNKQLKEWEGKTIPNGKAAFPRLYYTDLDGRTTKIKDLDVHFSGRDIMVQTDLTDGKRIKNELETKLKAVYKHDAETLKIILDRMAAIEEAMPDIKEVTE